MKYYEVKYNFDKIGYNVKSFKHLVDALNFIDENGIKKYKLYKITKKEITVIDN